jgi:hypothetical protein
MEIGQRMKAACQKIWSNKNSRLYLVLYGLAITFLFLLSQGERSGFVRMGAMVRQGYHSGLTGYSYFYDKIPMHTENFVFFWPASMFNGLGAPLAFYSMRAIYPFLGAILHSLFGLVTSFAILNYGVWVAAAYFCYRFTRAVFQDRLAGIISSFFVLTGMGWIVHAADYSAHSLSFMTYYLGILVIYESRVWCERRDLKTHLFLGIFLAVASLVYNTALPLIFGYALTALRKNSWKHVVLAVALAMTARPLWHLWMILIHEGKDFDPVEKAYFARALAAWKSLLPHPAAFLKRVGFHLKEFLSLDSPLVLGLGLLSILALRPLKNTYFFLVFMGLSLGAIVFYRPATHAAINYCIYGISLFWNCALAGVLAKAYRAAPKIRWLTVGGIGFLCLFNLFWATAYFWGYYLPLFSYTFGYAETGPELYRNVQKVLSLTGLEPTPAFFGGLSNLVSAGFAVTHEYLQVFPKNPGRFLGSFFLGMSARVFIMVYLAALIWTSPLSRRWKKFGVTALILIVVGTLLVYKIRVHKELEPFRCWNAYSIEAGEELTYKLEISEEFIRNLENHRGRVKQMNFYIGMTSPKFRMEMKIGDKSLTVSRISERTGLGMIYAASLEDVLELFKASRQMTVRIHPEDTVWVRAWQKNPLPGRELNLERKLLPLFEIHLISQDESALLFAGF